MPLKIILTNRNTGEKKNYQFAKSLVILGRHTDCDIIVPAAGASRKHAQISVNKNLVEVEDLGSGNGTLLGPEKLKPHEKTPVKDGDRLRIEEYDIELHPENPQTSPAPIVPSGIEDSVSVSSTMRQKFEITDPDIIEIKMIKKVLGALEQEKQPVLQVVSGPFSGHKVVIDDTMDEVVIGRDPVVQLVIDDASISRRHAAISQKWGSYVIRDLGSKNGTFLNTESVKEERRLKDGDELVFGTVKAIFKNPRELDFEAIGRSISENQVKAAPTDPIVTPEPAPRTIEDVAPSPESASKPEDKPAPPVEKAETSPPPEPEAQESTEKPKEKTEPRQTPKKKTPSPLGRLGPTELALLGLGAFVILVILISFIVLFS